MNTPSSQHLTVHISPKSVVLTLLILVAAATIFILRDLFLAVLAAVVLAAAVNPAVEWFERFRISRLPAILIVYLSGVVVAVALFVFLIQPLVSQTFSFLNQLPQYLETLDAWASSEAGSWGQTGELFGAEGQFSLNQVTQNIRETLAGLSGGLLSTLFSIFGGLFSFVIIVVLSLYLSVQRDGVANFLRRITPVQHERYVLDLWGRSQTKIGLWVRGQIILMVVVGVLTYLGLLAFGIEHALLLAFLAAFAELVPLFGPVMAAIPAVLIAFGSQGWLVALLVALFYLAVQQIENHLIYPLVVQKVVGISPVVVIIALIAGWQLAGFLGVLLSVPVAAILMEVLNDFGRPRTAPLGVSESDPSLAKENT